MPWTGAVVDSGVIFPATITPISAGIIAARSMAALVVLMDHGYVIQVNTTIYIPPFPDAIIVRRRLLLVCLPINSDNFVLASSAATVPVCVYGNYALQ